MRDLHPGVKRRRLYPLPRPRITETDTFWTWMALLALFVLAVWIHMPTSVVMIAAAGILLTKHKRRPRR